LIGIAALGAGARAQSLPADWVGAGAGYNPGGSPKVTAWASLAILVNQSSQLYSYSTYDVVPQRGAIPVTSARTGAATVLRTFGRSVYLLGFATIGAATSSTATTGSVSGGGILVYRFKPAWTVECAVRAVNGSATNKVVEFGFGRAFGGSPQIHADARR
jgi:hypothetical protein